MSASRQKLIKYATNHVWKAEEFGLFKNPILKSTIGPARLCGRKEQKQRATFLVCANEDVTEKYQVWIIGRSQKPRYFEGNSMGDANFCLLLR